MEFCPKSVPKNNNIGKENNNIGKENNNIGKENNKVYFLKLCQFSLNNFSSYRVENEFSTLKKF